jgi:putative copper resistance protein D
VQAFADFSSSLVGGLQLVALSLVLGGVAWGWFVLVPWREGAPLPATRACIALLGAGAAGVAIGQVAALSLQVIVLSGPLEGDAFALFRETLPFRAGATQAAAAAVLAVASGWLALAPRARRRWEIVSALAALVAVSGAWLVHGAGRLEHRAPLMAVTVLHQVGAAVWAGGLLHLFAAWRLSRRDAAVAAAWPALVSRFSRVAIGSVLVLLLAGVPLVWSYIGSWDGLVGSGYGSLVVTKALLMAGALVLGALNYVAGRRASAALRSRVPFYVEAETLLLVSLLFAAASLSGQPPPVDTGSERASLGEVVEVFRPKWPDLRTPSVAVMVAQDAEAGTTPMGVERTREAYLWSNFSHNVAGLVLLAMGIVALAAIPWPASWARHWPAGFLVLAAFVFLRTSANDGVWPFGDVSFWRSLGDAEVLQHRLGALLAVAVGAIEWRARVTRRPGGVLPYVFPLLAAAGGLLLLTHAHAAFEIKSAYLVQVTHTAMGALAVVMACARLLELRLPAPASRVAGAASTAAMVMLALVLVFYREANVEIGEMAVAAHAPAAD